MKKLGLPEKKSISHKKKFLLKWISKYVLSTNYLLQSYLAYFRHFVGEEAFWRTSCFAAYAEIEKEEEKKSGQDQEESGSHTTRS